MTTESKKPLLPLRDIVIFPSIVVPLFVGRKKSIKALEEVMKSDKSVVLVTQKNSEVDDPGEKDIYSYGCLSKVLQLLKLPDGTVKVLVEGLARVKILEIQDDVKKYLSCKHIIFNEKYEKELKLKRKEDSIIDKLRFDKGNIHEAEYFEKLKKNIQKLKI